MKDLTNEQIKITLDTFSINASRYAVEVERDAYISESTNAVLFYPVLSHLKARFGTNENKVAILGCGTGRDISRFQEHGYSVDGFDALNSMLLEARKRVSPENVNLICANVENYEFPKNHYICVFCDSILCYLSKNNMVELLAKIHSMLLLDGVAMLCFKVINGEETIRQNQLFGLPRYFKIYSKIAISDFINKSNLQIISVSENHDSRNLDLMWYNVLVERK